MSWALNAPADAGCPVTASTVTCSGTGATRSVTVAGDLTSTTVGSLEYGANYTCTVVVTSGAGASLASPASAMFTVATQPSAPLNVEASFPGTEVCDLNATVTWMAPSDGGDAITSYTVTCAGTDVVGPVIVTGLTATLALSANQAYNCSVVAANGAGAGPPGTAAPITRCEPA